VIRKTTVYNLAMFVWAGVSAGGFILAYSGNAEPFVSAAQMPGGGATMFGGVAASWILGALVVGRLKTRDWKAAGRAAGLGPEGSGLLGKPDLTGTVGGRTVRARTRKKKTGSSGTEGGSSKSTFTVVEADLAEAADRGVIVGHGDASDAVAFGDVGTQTTEVGDGFWVVGAEEAFARELLDQRSRDALRALDVEDGLLVGDAAGMMESTLDEAMGDSRVGNFFASTLAGKALEKMAGDAATVSMETKGLVLDAGAVERRAEAVATVADAFEAATTDRV
jgi:hypothetical protein